MISIELTSISGTPPYNISICDITKTFCYIVATGNPTLPVNLPIPVELMGVLELLVVIEDSLNCEYFEFISCVTTTTTSTTTTTTLPPPNNCLCLTFENNTLSNLNYSYKRCDGLVLPGIIFAGTTLYYCGSEPTGDVGVNISIGNPCVDNTCPDPGPIDLNKQFQSGEYFDFMDDLPYDFQDT
jgi:hypothetical protein